MAYYEGYLYGVFRDNHVHRTKPSSWDWNAFTHGNMIKIIIHEGIIYGISKEEKSIWTNNRINTGENQRWTKIAPPHISDLAICGETGQFMFGVDSIGGNVYRTKPNLMKWTQYTSGTRVTKIICHGGIIYGLGKDDLAIYRTSAIVEDHDLPSKLLWTKLSRPGRLADFAIKPGNKFF